MEAKWMYRMMIGMNCVRSVQWLLYDRRRCERVMRSEGACGTLETSLKGDAMCVSRNE